MEVFLLTDAKYVWHLLVSPPSTSEQATAPRKGDIEYASGLFLFYFACGGFDDEDGSKELLILHKERRVTRNIQKARYVRKLKSISWTSRWSEMKKKKFRLVFILGYILHYFSRLFSVPARMRFLFILWYFRYLWKSYCNIYRPVITAGYLLILDSSQAVIWKVFSSRFPHV